MSQFYTANYQSSYGQNVQQPMLIPSSQVQIPSNMPVNGKFNVDIAGISKKFNETFSEVFKTADAAFDSFADKISEYLNDITIVTKDEIVRSIVLVAKQIKNPFALAAVFASRGFNVRSRVTLKNGQLLSDLAKMVHDICGGIARFMAGMSILIARFNMKEKSDKCIAWNSQTKATHSFHGGFYAGGSVESLKLRRPDLFSDKNVMGWELAVRCWLTAVNMGLKIDLSFLPDDSIVAKLSQVGQRRVNLIKSKNGTKSIETLADEIEKEVGVPMAEELVKPIFIFGNTLEEKIKRAGSFKDVPSNSNFWELLYPGYTKMKEDDQKTARRKYYDFTKNNFAEQTPFDAKLHKFM